MKAPLTVTEAAHAAERCARALAARPDYPQAAQLLAGLLQRYEFAADIDIAPRGLEAAFAFADVDRQALCNGAITLLKGRSPLADIVAKGRTADWESAADMLIRKGARLLRDTLFAAALTHGVVSDIEIERLLTALRRLLLLSPTLLARRQIENFVCVLARQCLNNEYVFFVAEDEVAILSTLLVDFDAACAGDKDACRNFMRWSLYNPVHEATGLVVRDIDKLPYPALRDLLHGELAARREEAALANGLVRLTPVNDETSRRVADQYRQDPYPRWLSLQAPEPGSAAARLRGHFSVDELSILDRSCDVLIAGAGTGRQAVNAALGYGADARVQAIDLSAPSLAYGARMAEMLGVANLRFAIGDILHLGETVGEFDVIECVGVLHHLADPYEGWCALTARLRPGGLMLIGLYSAVSRRVIGALSNDPDWPGPEADDGELRAYRRVLMDRAPDADGFALTQSPDFFTKSGFRDLALHVSEQQYTIPEIGDFMASQGLDFHGFSLPDETLRAYADAYPDDAPPGTLNNWATFEQANPATFAGMYLFWCRRPN